MTRQRSPRDHAIHDDEAADDRRFVTALARGLAVLRCFQPQDRWLAHQELSRRTGLPQATVSRLTFTLTALGYLRHRGPRGEYALAPGVLALGFSMLSNFDIGRIARPHMQALADHAQAAVSLGVRHGLNMIYVAHCRSTARLILGLDVGARLPLASTAMGRSLLVALAPAERQRLVAQLQTAEAERWPQLADGLARAAQQFDARGFVTSEREWESEITAVGAPVQLAAGREPLGLTVGGASVPLPGPWLH
ncbi:MAG: IclR family transcriptional regulator, partial [Burkholderiales bacterium PBB5]